MSQTPLFSIEHATVRHLNKVLFQGLSFRVYPGEQWAIAGESGSGKTALLKTIAGQFNIIDGPLKYDFYEAFKKEHPEAPVSINYRSFMSYVSFQPHFKNKQNTTGFYYQQRFSSWDSQEAFTVKEYLESLKGNRGDTQGFIPEIFTEEWIVTQFRLKELEDKTIIQLSNGETRRLIMARALMKQPRILLLDNPLSGLDVDSRAYFSQLLGQIAEKGVALLLVTEKDRIPHFITHVLELDEGKIVNAQERKKFVSYQHHDRENDWQVDTHILQELLKRQNPIPKYQRIISLINITVRYGDQLVLDHIDWTVEQGEKWALSGSNGAGKSTLLSLILRDNPQAYANDITLFDSSNEHRTSIWEIRAQTGFVSPELHRYFHNDLKCFEAALTGFTDSMVPIPHKITEEQKETIRLWMRLFDLEHLSGEKLKFVSTGEQRLVLLIRALVKNPALLILDEPCQGLDRDQTLRFKRILETLYTGADKTLIYVSHYQEEIPNIVKHHLELENGKIRRMW